MKLKVTIDGKTYEVDVEAAEGIRAFIAQRPPNLCLSSRGTWGAITTVAV